MSSSKTKGPSMLPTAAKLSADKDKSRAPQLLCSFASL